MNISKSAYIGAVKKLMVTNSGGGYDYETGNIHPEYVLTDNEKNSLLYYVENDLYKKIDVEQEVLPDSVYEKQFETDTYPKNFKI